jgi:NADPH:quinone reductase-like Zn-dependent oxidoreductase
MKAIIRTQYGGPEVLQLQDLPKPQPAAGELLIKVHAASINSADWRAMRAVPWLFRLAGGLFKPKSHAMGSDFAGTVETVGEGTSRFQPGDRVYGDLSDLGCGTFAEYICVAENVPAPMPDSLTFEQAAALPLAAVTAWQGFQKAGGLQPGQKVLVNGASGGVGSYALQLAKAAGARVTAVCSTRNLEQAMELGADQVIDYRKEDFWQKGEQHDLIFAANGDLPLSAYRQALSPTGTYVMVGGSTRQIFAPMLWGGFYSKKGGKTFTFLSAKYQAEDLEALNSLITAGKLKAVVEKVYALEELPEAMRYFEETHPRGKLVIKM